MAEETASDSDAPLIDDNVIRIQFRKPNQQKWELRTRNLSPSVRFPTIQLFDCEGNLLVETNDENISIKSSDFDENGLRTSKSLREKDFRHYVHKKALKKNKTISGGKIYTRVFRTPPSLDDNNAEVSKINKTIVIRDTDGVTNIPSLLNVDQINNNIQIDSKDNSPLPSDGPSEISSIKSSDNESYFSHKCISENKIDKRRITTSPESSVTLMNESDVEPRELKYLKKSKSLNYTYKTEQTLKQNSLQRSKSGITYKQPNNKISFLNTYLKSLPTTRMSSNPDWLVLNREKITEHTQSTEQTYPDGNPTNKCRNGNENTCRFCKWDITPENDFVNVPTDAAADCEFRKRLKIYRRGISEIEFRNRILSDSCNRRHSLSGSLRTLNSSSSESVDEADHVLNRLRRRILKNKMRERKRSIGSQTKSRSSCHRVSSGESWHDVAEVAHVRARCGRAMGSNISQHSAKGLKGRRARSSGDLCNGDTKSQTESSVCGSVVGDVMGWNRSLPNHLDGNRHLADYSRVNNNYGEFGTYNRRHQKGGRGLRYRVFKTGSDADPVWKLQDPGCDQGYGSERSPEDDYAPPIEPAPSLEEYEEQLRTIYPFINDENTYTVVVEKDGRGLGMSVCGGGGLVRIRRLYPPQPAWRTGRLAPRDLLLAANGVPLAGLSTYEALEVLRTASPRVELRVCRPPSDVLESVTPPDPPTPPARTPHPPHLPPPDPLNCHPLHARLSATTSSATTSSSEGRGRREGSPEDRRDDRRGLHLPGLDKPLPVFDVQYGEFDIIMTKVNGSLGFTLRKEDHSALGHYVRALVREPALSDGRIQPGDRIVAVNDTPMSNMSHAEAVSYLRSCGAEVRLRLYRDHAATPLSPMSPKEGPTTTDSDAPICKPKPPLRAEAVSMLCDLAARRLTPDAVDGSRSPCLSPRKFRRLTKENNHYEQPNDRVKFSLDSLCIDGCTDIIIQEIRPAQRAHSTTAVDYARATNRQSKLSLTVPPQDFQLNSLDSATLDAPSGYQEEGPPRFLDPIFHDTDEPVSMPAELSNDEARFKHANPAYQSAVLHSTTSNNESSSNSDGHKDDGHKLKKWKGVTLSPDNERKAIITDTQPKIKEAVQKENVKPAPTNVDVECEPTIVTVELSRGWNSRLGFSVQTHPESGQSYISAVYSDSVAARDGRLRSGDVILQVNDENVTSMKTPEVIDLLRILRGSICITVLRPPNPQ